MIDFIVLKSKEEFFCPIDDCNIYYIESLAKISQLQLKKENLSIICESGDFLSEEYVNSAIKILNEFGSVGCVYSNYKTIGGRKIFIPSFCRQKLVTATYLPPITCVVRNCILNRINIIENSRLELFLKISNSFALYHMPDFLYIKSYIHNYNTSSDDLGALYELFNSNS